MHSAALMIGMLAALVGPAQDSAFESSDFGIRLRIPPKWNIDATRQARVILKLNQTSESLAALKPELLVYEAPFAEPITLGQYREQLRHFIQRAFKEPRMLDDRAVTAGGKPGLLLAVASKGTGDADVVTYKGLFQVSPRRMIGVDGTFPKGQEEELAKVYDALLATIEFLPRRTPPGTEDGLRRFEELLGRMSKEAPAAGASEELGIFIGDKRVGSYTVGVKPATERGAAGVEMTGTTRIDLGEDGKVETRVRGFLAADLSTQVVEQSEVKVGKDKRVQNFEAMVILSGQEARVARRINGERSEATVKVPPRTVLSELVEALQGRLQGAEKGLVMFPALAAYDNEPSWVKIELTGLNKMRVDDATVEVYVSFLQREEGALQTSWYDAERKLVRVSQGSQGFMIRRVK